MVLMNCDESWIIEADELVKRFGKIAAVNGLSLRVKKGEIYGFLGPNGAGKTTTVRMLTTMDLPDTGTIMINGHRTSDDFIHARQNLGVIQQHMSLEKDISVKENIIHHGLMQNMSLSLIKKRMTELCDLMELNDRLDMLVGNLSGGWKKRVSIVCSLIHDPAILFMDEPTTGLDTQSRMLLWKMIRSINKRGTTIFLTTHYIYEAENLCHRIGIISSGKMLVEGTPSELRSRIPPIALVDIDADENETVRYFNDRGAAGQESMSIPSDHKICIRDSNLEDVFLEYTGRRF